MTIGEKIRNLRKDQHLGLRELSRLSNISPSQISRLEHGDYIPRFSTVDRLARGLHVTERYLYSYLGIVQGREEPNSHKVRFKEMPNNAIISKNYVKLPVLGSIPCGDPNTAIRETNEYKLIPSFEPHQGCFFLRADGHSMEPEIKNKSLVKIHLQRTIENKEIAAVSIDGADATLKQVIKNDRDKIVMFHPLNPRFRDIFPNPDNQCRIIGKAVAVTNSL